VKSSLLIFFTFCASAVMLTVIQVPFGLDELAWVALVPLILVCRPDAKPGRLMWIGYLVSLFYWLGNLYWLGFVTSAGWIAFCLYMGLYWPILALCIRFCRIKKVPLILAVPVLFVGAEAFQGVIWTGFSWRFLAHSQYANIRLIQMADIFGAGGVTFLVAMVNGVIAELIIAVSKKQLFRISNFVKAGITSAMIIGVLFYGRWRAEQTKKFVRPGPLVATVQSNVPLDVKESGQASEQIFTDLLQLSRASARSLQKDRKMGSKPELIVWPETMVQQILDERFLLLCDPCHPARLFDKALCEHSRNRAYILVGSHAGRPEVKDGQIYLAEKYNSAFLYRPDGQQDRERYDKIHLVPFGEFVPFKDSLPFVHKLLMRLTPYDYDYTLNRGKEYTVFEMSSNAAGARFPGSQTQRRAFGSPPKRSENGVPAAGKVYRFSVMICYEDTVPDIARRFAIDEQGKKRVDWLVNISNDGWFVRFKQGKVFPSTELSQHTAICVFRAVENRLPVLRSVNTGISCVINSIGQIKDGFVAGTLPTAAMERQGLAGWLVDRISIDDRTTFFSKHGQWLDFCCAICFVVIIIILLPAKFIRRCIK